MPKITKRVVDSIKPLRGKDVWIWDDVLPGFGVRVKPSGSKSYLVQYRNLNRTRRYTLGKCTVLTPDQARAMARGLLAETAQGRDPSKERSAAQHAVDMGELCKRYMEEHAEPKKKSSSAEKDKRYLERFVIPKFGRTKVAEVTREDISTLHHSLRETPYQANRVLEVLKKMFNLAEDWGMRPDGSNPCRRIQKYKEKKRERFLKPEEMARLGAVLVEAEEKESENLSAVRCIRLLLFTGCRLNEIKTLKWEYIDFSAECINLPDSKTGAKTVPLSRPALDILKNTPRIEGNPYVCTGLKPGDHIKGIDRPWFRLREKAGLQDVRLHDLRHSFASVAVASNLGLPIVGALLGHTQPNTTQRYAHLTMDPLKAAADLVAEKIAEQMNKPVEKKVIPFPKRKR